MSEAPKRQTEDTTVDVDALLGEIRKGFYAQAGDKRFYQDRQILLFAITWPASWLKGRGVTWTKERYFQTLRAQLAEIKRHGATGEIRSFGRYLAKCLQDHFAHNSDDYCAEGKSANHVFDLALGRVMSAAKLAERQRAEATIDTLAEAHRLLAPRRRPNKVTKPDDFQPSLF